MKETLKVINEMVKDGVIEEYAIGGAVAAIYYLEPFDTADLDVFVQVETSGSDLTILAPLYEYLTGQGYKARGEFVYVEGLPVQFLPVFNPLTEFENHLDLFLEWKRSQRAPVLLPLLNDLANVWILFHGLNL